MATWDPQKAEENERKHGVRFSDAEVALWDPFALTVEDERAELERRHVTIGCGALGRVLVVVYTSERGCSTDFSPARDA